MPSQTRKITLDTAALFFGRAVGLLLGVVRLNYLATYLGLSNFGILNFATYFTSLFQSLFDLGLSQLLTREVARHLSRSRELVGGALAIKVVIAILSSGLLTLVVLFSRFDATINVAILLTTIAVAINSISMALLSALQAHRKMVVVSIANIINDAALSGAIILLIPHIPTVTVALVLTGLVAIANLAVLFVLYSRIAGPPRLPADMATSTTLLREGIPMAVSSLGISLYTFVGPTILKYTRGEEEVGLYSAGYKLISILTLIPTAFTQVIYPVFSDFFANAREKLGKALADSLRVISIISVPLATGAVLLGPRIFQLLYTQQYRPGVIVLQVMIIGNVFGYMDWVLASFLLAVNRQAFLMGISLGFGLLATVAGLLLIPSYGFVALPFLSATIECLLFGTQYLYLRRHGYTVFSFAGLIKPLVAAGVMAVALLAAGTLHIVLLIPLGAVVYASILYLIRGYGEQERAIIDWFLTRTVRHER